MPLTVAALLAHRELELVPLVRGDLDRVIRWVHSSEMPDPSAYLRGDEVVLSAGIWFWAGSSPRSSPMALPAPAPRRSGSGRARWCPRFRPRSLRRAPGTA